MFREAACLALLVFGIVDSAPPPESQAPAPLTITYLANMGVTIEAGGVRVVIDGLHRGELADYAPVPAATLAALESGAGPASRLDLALTTHRHLDHFAARSVAARLRADTVTRYLAARETVDTLIAHDPSLRTPRVLAVTPSPGGSEMVRPAGIPVTVLDLPHNATRTRTVENVGFLVELGGRRVLHVGDADPALASFRPHRLPARGVDVAIVPFWYVTGDMAVLREGIGARLVVATHVPPADTAAIRRRIERALPGAVVFTDPGASYTVR